jgi:Putative mono-oxygenase ydhR
MRIRIVTFGLTIPSEAYTAHAEHIVPGFTAWPGLLGKWWLADPASGTYGGVYLFASQQEADLSRRTDLFRGMLANPSLSEVTVREFDVLEAPTAVTAPSSPAALPARGGR